MENNNERITEIERYASLTTDELVSMALEYLDKLDEYEANISQLEEEIKATVDHKAKETLKAKLESLREQDDDTGRLYWNIVHTLRTRGSEAEFSHSKDLMDSSIVNQRILGIDILGDLYYQDRSKYYDYVVARLIEFLDDKDEDVIASAVSGLGKRCNGDIDLKALPKLIDLANHKNRHIRVSVVHALAGSEHRDAIQTMIKLCRDEHPYVRDWAVFSLGSQIEVDTAQIREALHECLKDDDYDVRGEALIGLAERGDKSMIEALKQELDGEFEASYAIRASELLADKRLLPYLIRLKENHIDDMMSYQLESLENAIKVCS